MKQITVLLTCFIIYEAVNAQSWKLTGNAGTTPDSNFIGTTDANALMFKVKNKRSGYIDFVSGKANTSFGFQALKNPTGNNNAAFGYKASYSNTTGIDNTAEGFQALYSNTTGYSNTASGSRTLYFNTTGYFNTANGVYALYSNTTGRRNTAIGYASLYLNTTGESNTAIGHDALHHNTTGNYNTAIGLSALVGNTTGYYNTASGFYTLAYNTTGYDNTATGYDALQNNTIGYGITAIGAYAGNYNDNSTWCTFIGYDANQSVSDDLNNSSALGYGGRITYSNQVRIGNSYITSIGGQVGWTTLSDGRYKKQVKENVPGLQFINKLKPVTYYLDVTGISNFLNRDQKENKAQEKNISNDEKSKALIEQDVKAKEKIIYTGFIAQDVEKAAKELNYDFSGIDAAKNDKDLYGLRYAEFVVPLVKAVQELSGQNEELKIENEGLERKYIEQQKQIDELKALINFKHLTDASQTNINSADEGVSLFQNIPNPFNHTTTVYYTLPQQYHAAKIILSDNFGKTVKELTVTGKGKGSISIDTPTLAAGAYQYSLYVDGRLINTKQMVIAK